MSLVDFVKLREGCKLTAYWDDKGKVWTIGYGCTGPDVVQGTVWTQAQADQGLAARLAAAHTLLLHYSPGPFAPGAEDALTDFVYNEGIGNYRGSNLRKLVDTGQWVAVKLELLKWEYAGGVILAGLESRREGEANMILPA